MKNSNHRSLWTKIMVVLGSLGLLVGALDPLEGSVVILAGSGLLALGTWLGRAESRLIRYRTLVFILIAFGVGAMFGLSAIGGLGGKSGHSMWWGVLILPYLIGWSLGIWGPGNPRWVLGSGIVVGLWYLTLGGIALSGHRMAGDWALAAVMWTVGLSTIAGCVIRLVMAHRKLPTPEAPVTSAG